MPSMTGGISPAQTIRRAGPSTAFGGSIGHIAMRASHHPPSNRGGAEQLIWRQALLSPAAPASRSPGSASAGPTGRAPRQSHQAPGDADRDRRKSAPRFPRAMRPPDRATARRPPRTERHSLDRDNGRVPGKCRESSGHPRTDRAIGAMAGHQAEHSRPRGPAPRCCWLHPSARPPTDAWWAAARSAAAG